MCECNLIIGPDAFEKWSTVDHRAYNPLLRCTEISLQVRRGECAPSSAGHLLASLECEVIAITQLPVSLEEIEQIAGRKLYDPIR